jgi:hypothetical protein
MIQKKKFLWMLLAVLLTACGGGGSGDGDISGDNNGGTDTPSEPTPNPTASTLTAPENNNACLDGENVSFIWNASENTSSYVVYVKNLISKVTTTHPSNTTNTTIVLETGIPYSWYVKSISNETTTTASSSVWKFYLVGTPESNYAPYPAEITAPINGARVSGGSVILSWNGSDPDAEDTLSYQVVLDEQNPPTSIIIENTSNTSVSKNLSAGTYFWKVITTDNHNNNSDSGIASFEVN